MKIIFHEQEIIFEDAVPHIVFEVIQQMLTDRYYFDYFIIDGLRMDGDPLHIIEDYVSDAEVIEVIAIEATQFIVGLQQSMAGYVTTALPTLRITVERFQQQEATAQQWQDLHDLLEGMQWLQQVYATVASSTYVPKEWLTLQQIFVQLIQVLPQLASHLEAKNQQGIAHLLQITIYHAFEQIADQLHLFVEQPKN